MDINKIPLPTEMPSRPDFSNVPQDLLQSRIVESLIAQNDDLMARLSVNIRRYVQLEQKFRVETRQADDLKKKLETLADQVLVLKEKDRIRHLRSQQNELEVSELKSELEKTEMRYAQSYSASQKQIEEFKNFRDEQNELMTQVRFAYQRELDRLTRYKRRIAKYVSPYIQTLRAQNEFAADSQRQMEFEIKGHQKTIEDLRAQLAQFHDEIQEKTSLITEEKISVNNLERQLSEQHALALESENQNKKLKNRIRELEEHKVDLENTVIEVKRRNQEIQGHINVEVENLQKKMSEFRRQTKEQSIEIQNRKEENSQLNDDKKQLRADNDSLQSQVESLQTLWNDSRIKSEKANSKLEALTHLNRELTVKLGELRTATTDSKHQLGQKNVSLCEENINLRSQLDYFLNHHPSESVAPSSPAKKDERPHIDFDKLQEVESLLAEIQCGYTHSRTITEVSEQGTSNIL